MNYYLKINDTQIINFSTEPIEGYLQVDALIFFKAWRLNRRSEVFLINGEVVEGNSLPVEVADNLHLLHQNANLWTVFPLAQYILAVDTLKYSGISTEDNDLCLFESLAGDNFEEDDVKIVLQVEKVFSLLWKPQEGDYV